jgi:hypothetical protein
MDAELLRQVKEYWDGIAPYGVTFDENQGVRLLLYEVERYEAALLSIARKPADSLCQRRASRRKLLNARLW